MKHIVIEKLRLHEFKGGTIVIDFSPTTNIFGANKTGKTRLFDAFSWLLFGKNSQGESQFEIKTLDANNNAIPKLSHEVEAHLLINDTTLVLKRVYQEKWTKPRGQAEEVFSGHETTLFVDDVPVSSKEYSAKVDDICPEAQFKLLTNPLAFPTLNWAEQRKILFSMAGELSPSVVCSGNPAFLALLARMSDKKVKEYQDMLRIKKSKVNEQLEQIAPKIEENTRMMPEQRNWVELVKQITEKKDAIFSLEQQRESKIKAQEALSKKALDLTKEIEELKAQASRIELEQRQTSMQKYFQDKEDWNKLKLEHSQLEYQYKTAQQSEQNALATIDRLTKERELLLQEYTAIKAEAIEIDEDSFICPTCEQQLPFDKRAEMRATMVDNFNTTKATKLQRNIEKGKGIAEQITQAKASVLSGCDPGAFTIPQPVEPEFKFNPTPEYNTILSRITELEAQRSTEAPASDNLLESINSLKSELSVLEEQARDKDRIEVYRKRIKELQDQQAALSQEKADYEKEEDTLSEYNKFMIEYVEKKVSSLFESVKFKLYNKQVNGGEDPTCEAMVNGVPFGSLNNAGKIQAGLDIIKALQKSSGIYAPVWLDNRESVTEIPAMSCQVINLIVSPQDKSLRIN